MTTAATVGGPPGAPTPRAEEPGALHSAQALVTAFGPAVLRRGSSCGDTIVWVTRDRAHELLAWLKDTPGQQFDYLTDVTAVDYRDPEHPLEVVYQLRSLERKVDLRVKIPLDKREPLEVDSVWDLWKGADWLEREVYDMFGVVFRGHPDLRRILMWDGYAEGHPLRKDFPLRGHFSRAEQTRQALSLTPEGHYTDKELAIAEAFGELPPDVRERLRRGDEGAR
jgi:NADH-quinone oxidoreductase subunit C